MNVDVAVVGAGPAGSTLAALLARRGVSVALIDRDRFPRDKLCGEFLSYDALPVLEQLGVMAKLEVAPRILNCRVVGRRSDYEFEFPHAARGVSRLLLDELLVRCATDAGAADLTGWTAVRVSGSGVDLERDGETASIEARVVAGAWGRWGRFDAQLGRSFVRDRSHRSFGFKRHYRSAAAPASTIELYSFRRGYLGVSPVEGGVTNICGLVHASRLSGHKGRWDAFVETIRREEPALERLYGTHEPAQDGYLSSEPVIFRARRPIEGGVLMIGDASGVIDPLTGNGMAMAIQSALLAAPHVIRLVSSTDRRTAESDYEAAHSAFFAARIRWSRRVAKLLSNPLLLETALRSIRTRRAGEFLLRQTRATARDLDRVVAAWF